MKDFLSKITFWKSKPKVDPGAPKLCKDCVHYRFVASPAGTYRNAVCMKACHKIGLSNVDGTVSWTEAQYNNKIKCSILRTNDTFCGIEGKAFLHKDPDMRPADPTMALVNGNPEKCT
jgi:hypothetical protein